MEAVEFLVPPERLHPIFMPQGPFTLANKTGTWRFIKPIFRDRLAPCTHACRTGVEIRDFIQLIERGELEKAWHLIKEDNPMPAVTGRVCYHPCEEVCNRACYDQPVAIHCLERLVGDYGLSLAVRKAEITRKEKVAVVGSGPAGLSADYHLIRRGYGVTRMAAATGRESFVPSLCDRQLLDVYSVLIIPTVLVVCRTCVALHETLTDRPAG